MSTLQLQGQQLFDNVYQQFSDYQVVQGLADLFRGLFDLRRAAAADEWREFAQQTWLAHPLRALAHQDPITRRAFEKPRGYAGDAELIDMIYGLREMPQTSDLGAALYAQMLRAPAAQAVRTRRDHLAARLDEVAAKVERPRILAVACGHLREAQKSAAVAQGRFGEFIGLDQDPLSIAELAREQAASGIKAVNGSVKSILK